MVCIRMEPNDFHPPIYWRKTPQMLQLISKGSMAMQSILLQIGAEEDKGWQAILAQHAVRMVPEVRLPTQVIVSGLTDTCKYIAWPELFLNRETRTMYFRTQKQQGGSTSGGFVALPNPLYPYHEDIICVLFGVTNLIPWCRIFSDENIKGLMSNSRYTDLALGYSPALANIRDYPELVLKMLNQSVENDEALVGKKDRDQREVSQNAWNNPWVHVSIKRVAATGMADKTLRVYELRIEFKIVPASGLRF